MNAAAIMAMSNAAKETKYWNMPTREVVDFLRADTENGLSSEEAESRLAAFGPNTFNTEKKTGKLKIFLNQLASPLIVILIVAGAVTLAISHFRDAAFIFVAVIVNSVLGFWQENKAERALSELKTYLKQRARVLRGGVDREIDAEEIVPGDIIRLAQGDRVSADARIMFVNDFQVDESILTGESLPVAKNDGPSPEDAGIADQRSMIFAGTMVTQGLCTAVVCRTNASTELGKIASLIAKSEDEKTPLQKAIAKFSMTLSVILGLLTLCVFAIGIFSGQPVMEMFLTSVAVAVSAIPEGLPISMTVILAIGVERMAKRRGIVRKLVAAEALGGATVILTDKTGTLTMAKMSMSKVIPFEGTEDGLVSRALSNASVLIENPGDPPGEWRINGRIMEVALARSAALRGMPYAEINDKRHVLQSMPFNSVQKFSASLLKERGGRHEVILFGAADILLSHSAMSESKKREIAARISELASSGERVLGVAVKEIAHTEDFSFAKNFSPTSLVFQGLISFKDPVRAGIKHAVARVGEAGIKTVIVTGDHRGTAVAVAEEIGLSVDDRSVLDAAEIAGLSDDALKSRLPYTTVISRVTPFDKMRIAKLYQQLGEVVAMTGDGVNDAPVIKQADVGIAMGSGTEIARSVADLILLDDNFETIVAAIEEGRQIIRNIRKVLVYLLTNVADGLIIIGGSILIGVPLPLNALQILWVNFFSDSFPAVAFAFERDGDSLSGMVSRKKTELFDPLMKFLIWVIGILSSTLLLGIYLWLLWRGYEPVLVRTFIFAAFGTYTLLAALSVRSLEKSIWSYPLFSNQYLTVGLLIGFALMAAAIYLPLLQDLFGTVPLPLAWVAGVLVIGLFNIAMIEISKKFYVYRRSRRERQLSYE